MNIPSLFDSIAKRYDLTNHIASFGFHILWKRELVKEALKDFSKRGKLLDIACGTGDIIKFTDKIAPQWGKVGLDPSKEMLKIAQQRLAFVKNLSLIRGFAESIPFKDNTFEVITVSFGVRNFKDRSTAFREIYRVLKPKGVFAILEFSRPDNGNILQNLSWWYTKNFVPFLGRLITDRREAYEYLVNSIREFPTPDQLRLELKEIGFQVLEVKRLLPPIAVLYLLTKA